MSPAAQRVRFEVSGLPPGVWQRRLFMVLHQAFFDESGNSPSQVMLVVGGLLASAPSWIAFAEAWAARLKKEPGADFVKYSEITRGKGQFADDRGWTDELRAEALTDFASIIRRHCLGYAFSAMRHELFEKYVRSVSHQHRNLLIDNPYPTVAMNVALPTIKLMMLKGSGDTCDFYFDAMHGSDSLILEQWPDLQETVTTLPEAFFRLGPKPIIGKVRFESDKEFLPLQGADIVAGMVRNKLLGETTPPALAALNAMPWAGLESNEREIRESGAKLIESAEQMRVRFPNAPLLSYDQKTAKTLRKKLERPLRRKDGPKA